MKKIYPRFKRIFDCMAALAALLILAPFFILLLPVLSGIVRGNPFFTQLRVGRGNRIFRIYKLRTMTDARDAAGNLLSDAERLTRTGIFLRSTSLDELPQLLNVVKGDMALVGPRPLLTDYISRYSPRQARRHEVRPGITGWAQIHGRNALSWDRKFELDVWYVDHMSFRLDLKIMIRTCFKVLAREHITPPDHISVEPFEGN